MTQILTFVSHFELPNGSQFLQRSDNLGQIKYVAILLKKHTQRLASIKRRETISQPHIRLSAMASFPSDRSTEYVIS